MAVYRTTSGEPDDEKNLPAPLSKGGGELLVPGESKPTFEPLKFSMESIKGLFKGMNHLLDDIVVALGSDNLYVASREQPQPAAFSTYVAMSKINQQVIAAGDKAKAMLGREPQNITVFPLLKHGMPEIPELFGQFLLRVLKKHFAMNRLVRPRILCAGNFYNQLVREVCSDAFYQAKTRDVLYCEPEMAAAAGMGLDIFQPDLKSVMVFERDWMGFMVISMTGSLTKLRLNIGFDDLLQDIQIYFEESNDFAPRLEDLSQQFRNAGFTGTQNLIGWEAWVDQVERGKPLVIEADSMEYQRAVTPTILRIKHAVNRSLEGLTREQRYTVQTSPTYLAGEFAELPGFKELLQRAFGREVRLAMQPAQAMATGLVNLIPKIERLRAINGSKSGEVEI